MYGALSSASCSSFSRISLIRTSSASYHSQRLILCPVADYQILLRTHFHCIKGFQNHCSPTNICGDLVTEEAARMLGGDKQHQWCDARHPRAPTHRQQRLQPRNSISTTSWFRGNEGDAQGCSG